MKKLFYFVTVCILSVSSSIAQVPQSFKYQAVARDIEGNVISDQQLSLRINLLQGSRSGQLVYSEIHNVKTNRFGLINIEIGKGKNKTGEISAINWGLSQYFVNIEIDINGGVDYVNIGVSQLLSVPYALYAEESGNSDSKKKLWWEDGNHIYNTNPGNVGIGTTLPSHKLEVNGNIKADYFIGDGSQLVNLPEIPIKSVAGKTGNVTLTKEDVALDNVENTSDVDKPVSIAAQIALDEKQEEIIGAASSITDADLEASRVLISDIDGKVATLDVSTAELSYLDGVTTPVQSQLDTKQEAISGAASSITDTDLEASRVLISDIDGKVATLDVSTAELSYLDGVTTSVQSQLDLKQEAISGAASSITDADLEASRVLISDIDGKVATLDVSTAELSYLDGVTTSVQSQLDLKQEVISGAASSIAEVDLEANRVLISDIDGKVATMAVTKDEIACLDGVTTSVQLQLDNKVSSQWSGSSNLIYDGGNVGIGTSTPTAKLDIEGLTGYEQLRMRKPYTPSGTSDSNGNIGDMAWDNDYIYIKTNSGWKRAALSTW